MTIILGLLAGGLIYWLLTRNVKPPPEVMTKEELLDEGMTPAEARRELRAQRNELRSHSSTISQATRTGNQLANSVTRALKKPKRRY